MNRSICCILASILVGCSSAPTQTDVRVEVISPPDSLLQEVPIETPPEISDYIYLHYLEKEGILVDKYRAQTLNIERCNSQLRAIQNWKKQTIELYNKSDTAQ